MATPKRADHPGTLNAGIPLLPARSLDAMETNLDGHDKALFMQLARKMIQWTPEDRSTAADLLKDTWINSH